VDTVSVIDCATDPTTATGWYTAFVNGNTYPALSSDTIVYSSASLIYVPYTFEGLIITMLTPGEVITMVNHTNQLSNARAGLLDYQMLRPVRFCIDAGY
jgi:hypothetical protein